MSSGTRKEWAPSSLPQDETAAQRLREWLEEDGGLDAVGLNLSGADLSYGDFSLSLFIDAKLINTKLVQAELYRSDAQGADLSGADLTGSSLVRVNLDEAILRNVVLDAANLGKASLYDVDASGASCRGTRFMGADLLGVNFRSADLRGAVFEENSFEVTMDEDTKIEGMTGSVFGPAVVVEGAGPRELSGGELEEWIRSRGGTVRVIDVSK
ncbi:hypothetical protein CLM62_25055 [Streptomyces sp. SA15]|nr:hypothetical protein CLM62_25055 [Streptomyces sp. SA15]